MANKLLGPETREALAQLRVVAQRTATLVKRAEREGLTYEQGTVITELVNDVTYWGNALDRASRPDGNK